ncbi:hypothetical protein BC832DRAFT_563700 [Gaertneriomyces semiglobifer]|nr:hypothetical protein BC832DRAFT_563700 [Gaertneriomyces semiglobifer]
MSQILTRWLNEEVHLSCQNVRPDQLEELCSSGYYIGELLDHFKLVDGFADKFSRNVTKDTAINNYIAIEYVLRSKLDIRLSSNFVFDLITGKPGCAPKLLYQIKSAITRRHRTPSPLPRLPGQNHSSSTPVGFSLGTHEQRSHYVKMEHEFFANMLKAKFQRHTAVGNGGLAAVAPTDRVRQYRSDDEKSINSDTSERCGDLMGSEQSKDKVRATAGRTDAGSVKTPTKHGLAPVISAVNQFEEAKKFATLADRRGTSTYTEPEGNLAGQDVAHFISLKAAMDSENHLRMLSSVLPPVEALRKQKNDYLEKIHLRKLEEAVIKKQRDCWRRQKAIEDQNHYEDSERRLQEQTILAKLSRQSKQERRIAEQLMQIRHEREVIRQNRLLREQQYVQRRQKDYEVALAREHERCKRAREEYVQSTALRLQQHKDILESRAAASHHRHRVMCEQIISDVLDLSFKISDYQDLNDGKELPRKLLNEWKTLFLDGRPMATQYDTDMESDRLGSELSDAVASGHPASPSVETELAEAMQLLDETEFCEYLDGRNDWTFSGGNEESTNRALATLIDSILEITAPPDPPREVPQLPAGPIKLALVGKPFAGKRTLANQLAEKYGILPISVDELIQKALRVSDELLTRESHVSTPTPAEHSPSKAEVAARLQGSLLEGRAPEDELLVFLVVDAIQEALSQPSPDFPGGIVLVDFPRNKQQSQLLERELTGYEDPKPVKLGNIKRTPKEKTRRRSQIAPAEIDASSKDAKLESGLDGIILLNVDNETVYRRASGRRMDPVAQRIYHLDHQPPPTTVPKGTIGRLSSLGENESETAQLQFQVTTFEDQQELMKDWYHKFNNFQIVDSDCEPAEVGERMCSVIEAISLDKHRRMNEGSQSVQPKVEMTAQEADVRPGVNEASRSELSSPPTVLESRPVSVRANDEDKKPKTPSSTRGASSGPRNQDRSKSRTASASVPGEVPISGGVKGRGGSSTKDRGLTEMRKEKGSAASASDRQINNADVALNNAALEILSEFTAPLLIRPLAKDGRKLPAKSVADILADQWATIEISYKDSLKFGFRSLRREKEVVLRYFHGVKSNFRRFLERPDNKQKLVELFQAEFNMVEDDLRSDQDAKAELHQRAEDLRERLWELSDKRRDEAEAERLSIIEDKWVEDHFVAISNVYIIMLQAEVDRYVGTRSVVLDFYRDTHGLVMEEIPRSAPRIPLIPAAAQSNIDMSVLASVPSADALQKQQRRDILNSADLLRTPNPLGSSKNRVPATGAPPAAVGTGAKKILAGSGKAGSVLEISRHGALAPDKEQLLLENESVAFTEISVATDAALSIIHPHEESTAPEKDKKDKKKNIPLETTEQKVEAEAELPVEFQQIMDTEEALFQRKIERIKAHAISTLKELRNTAITVYSLLDELILGRFNAEMDAIRELNTLVKEAIETEAKLPNLLLLTGEKLRVDFGGLTYVPEPEPRPRSPIEKQAPDHFTVTQLLYVARQLRSIAPNGIISAKAFIECLQRMAQNSFGGEPLPEIYLSGELAIVPQMCLSLDPYETGFLDWRKFVMIAARILPVPSIDTLVEMKKQLCSNGWETTPEVFGRTKLWFEDELVDSPDSRPYNRGAKLKDCLFSAFRCSNEVVDAHRMPEDSYFVDTASTDGFDAYSFLLCSCLDTVPKLGLQKAFTVASDDATGECSMEQVYQLLHFGLEVVDETHRLSQADINDPMPMELLARIFEQAGVGPDQRISFEDFVKASENQLLIQSCPVYILEDLSLFSRSRPSSALDGKGALYS